MKRIIVTALGVAALWSAAAIAQDLPLAERRAVAQYQAQSYPAFLNDIQSAAGFAVPVDVNWTKIAIIGKADRFKDPGFWSDIYFKPAIEALKGVGRDDMGKQALKAKLQKIVFTYDKDTAPASNYENGLKFQDGTLTVNFEPYVNVQDLQARADAIRKTLEAKL